MTIGALIDLGLDFEAFKRELAKLPVSGYELRATTTARAHLKGTKFDVVIEGEDHSHHHEAGHQHTKLSQIVSMIESSQLSSWVKEKARTVFTRLGEAEALAHACSLEEVEFHEVGAVDSIIDIVGACVGFEMLGVERFLSSPVHVGRGFAGCAHGRYPVPVPATAELLKGARVYATEIEAELVTPTGAALLSTFCESFGPLPEMRVERIGYGAGTKRFADFPNMLRLMLGETQVDVQHSPLSERVTVIEANVDDASPQVFGHLMERALAAGALEIFYTPVMMKKSRPATLVTVLCRADKRDGLIDLIFRETTTIGLRFHEVERRVLERHVSRVQTVYGEIAVKVAYLSDEIVNFAPEYADCQVAAERHQVPLREVMTAAVVEFRRLAGS